VIMPLISNASIGPRPNEAQAVQLIQQLNINQLDIMNSLRIARTALRVRPTAIRAPLQRRGYADAVSDKVGIPRQILRPQLTSLRSSCPWLYPIRYVEV